MGAMGESSKTVHKASTYIFSLVGVDVTSTQVDSTTTYVEASTLPNAVHKKVPRGFLHGGNGGKIQESSGRMHLQNE